MSPETIGSARYFSTNSEQDKYNKNLVHEYGVLKRDSHMGSTPSFKPYPDSNQKPISMFSSITENLPGNDTMGNKFDELEARLMSLENTLDGKPVEKYGTREYSSSPKSYNPFSPPQKGSKIY